MWERESKAFEEVRREYLATPSEARQPHGQATTKVLDVTRTLLIQAPPARVMAAFFNDADLQERGGRSRRVFTVARPLGTYAVEWESTDFKDDVLGRLGGAFHGTVIDFRPGASFFLADVYLAASRRRSDRADGARSAVPSARQWRARRC